MNDLDATMALAIGRILRLASRPFQPGDLEEYQEARATFLACAEAKGLSTIPGYRPEIRKERQES